MRFSLDTESGFKDVVFVTSAYGLGETVVGGTVNPDEWRLGWLQLGMVESQPYSYDPIYSGWWFGCHFLFSHILGIIIPIDVHIFQRGSNHQPEIMMFLNEFPIFEAQN